MTGSEKLNRSPEGYIVACLVQGAWERALKGIDRLGPSPSYAPHLAAVSQRALIKQKADQARMLAEKAIEMDPNCAGAYEALGSICLALKDGDGAEAAFHRAADIDAAGLGARLQLVQIYLQQRSPLQALPLIEQALDIAPWDDRVQTAIRDLRKSCESILGKDHHAVRKARELAGRCYQANSSARRATLSLCMITKNEAKNLTRVIRSVEGLATEIVVVDTGSTDDTVKIARRLGARVSEFEWIDDFAAARNRSLELATGDWILVLDADDEFTRDSGPALRSWLRRAADVDVVGLYRRYPYPGMQNDGVSIQPRLFRNGRGIHFEGAIHEQVVAAEGEPAVPGIVLTCTIYHHGAIEGESAIERRHERNLRILDRTLEKDPDNVLMAMYAGLTNYEKAEWRKAAEHFRTVIRIAGPDVEFLPKAYSCLANALLMRNRPDEAETAARDGLARYPEYPELWFCLGLIMSKVGRLMDAMDAHRQALSGRFGPSLNWHDWSCLEFKPHMALADLHLSFGDTDAAERHVGEAEAITGPLVLYDRVRMAISQTAAERNREAAAKHQENDRLRKEFEDGDPGQGVALVEALLSRNEIDEAETFVNGWLEAGNRCPEALLAHGKLLIARERTEAALYCFEQAERDLTGSARILIALAGGYRAAGRAAEARQALERASVCDDPDGAVASSLAELLLAEEEWEAAERWFEQSLAKREDQWQAWLGLGTARLRIGKINAAIECFQQAASLSGGGAQVRRALGEATAYLARKAA